MEVQQYFVVENNVVVNSVMWDGNNQTWQPPANAIMLISQTTPAMVWRNNQLTEIIGAGDVGFTWDGSVLITNQLKPEPFPPANDQPQTSGTTTI